MPFIEKDFPIEEINELSIREVNARKPIYLVHKWWARRPGPTFRAIILASFLDENPMKSYYHGVSLKDKLGYVPIILDPFMGGGTTVIEALRLGAKAVGVDVNPVAWFITKKETEPVDTQLFKKQIKRIETAVAERIKQYYKTICPKGHEADIMYAFWVRAINCENCKREIPLYQSFTIASVRDTTVVFCPQCNHIFTVQDPEIKTECENSECRHSFLPSEGYVKGQTYKCPHCTFTGRIIRAVEKQQKPPDLEMFAIEYFCAICDDFARKMRLSEKERKEFEKSRRGYKKAEDYDQNLFEEAKTEYEDRTSEIKGRLIPDQEIPDGLKTGEVKNFLYRYWAELFNERQLHCLSLLLEEILKIEDERLREHFLITLSDSINANNMLCKYNRQAAKLEPLFGHHAFWVPQIPIENNVWGTKYGRGTFTKYLKKTMKSIEYAKRPYELKLRENGSKRRIEIPNEQIEGKLTQTFNKLRNNEQNVMLLTTTSENLKSHVPDESVDAIITDPPYYNNVMYTELSDFFYIWMRLGLKDRYPMEFESPLIDKRREIVVNEAIGKGAGFYINAMKRCLAEMHRTLKNGGLFIMTFHHTDPKAWAAVLKALVESGFVVRGAYPIHSETRSGIHPGIRYDSIITCRKAEESDLPSKPLPKAIFESEVRNRVEADADRFVEGHPKLSIEDLFVAVMGRAFQVLSENYAVMFKSGVVLSIEDVRKILESLGDVAFDVLLKKFFIKTPDVDRVSKTFAAIFAGKGYVSLDTIDKVTKHGGIDFAVFEEEHLIGEKKKSLRKILSPSERKTEKSYLEKAR